MMEQDKKAPVSTPQGTALAPSTPELPPRPELENPAAAKRMALAPSTPELPPRPELENPAAAKRTALMPPAPEPTPVPAVKPAGWLTRETRLAVVVLVSFLALAAGVYAVKVLFKSKPSAESIEVAQTPPAEPQPQLPQQLTRSTALEPSPVAEIKQPTIVRVRADEPRIPDIEAPPIILQMEPPAKEVPLILPMEPAIVLPKEPAIKDPLAIEIDPPAARKDGFSSAKKEPTAKNDTPRIELPPSIDLPPPEVRNPVIRIGASEPKKEAPPKVELPAIPDPPLVIDPPMTKKNPPAIDPPLVIDPPMAKKNPPAIDPPLVIDPPMAKKDPPAIDPPLVIDPPMAKKDPPLVIDPPMTKKNPPTIEIELKSPSGVVPKKVEMPTTSNDYDEDLHPFRKEDTYRSISKQYYNSEAYSIALQRYNKDHPGQAEYVRVPPIWLLEKKYANDISSTSARSTSNAPPPSVDLTQRSEQLYIVGDNGEMLADIARQKLGSDEAWKRIWDLNPQINPAKLIPGGTRLRLP